MSEREEIMRKISVLQLAESLGNVSAACRRSGISRSQFYEYKKRFKAEGEEGLRNHPPIARYHPKKTPQEVADKIRMLALDYPDKGPNHIESLLESDGIIVSFVTIQKILEREGLGSRHHRHIELEKKWAEASILLSVRQLGFIERLNPVFRERDRRSSRPGEILYPAVFFAGSFPGMGRLYLHVVVDAYCGYAFGMLHDSKSPATSMALLDTMVLPFYEKRNITLSRIIIDGNSGFSGDFVCDYGHYLKERGLGVLNNTGIEVVNGFIEHFRRIFIKEFFRSRLHGHVRYDSLTILHREFDEWLCFYNRRPHPGYVNYGKTPLGRIDGYRSAEEGSD